MARSLSIEMTLAWENPLLTVIFSSFSPSQNSRRSLGLTRSGEKKVEYHS